MHRRPRVAVNGAISMTTDVHNHAIPASVVDLFRRSPAYGVEIKGSRWHGGHHVGFEVVPAFVLPEAKLEELERNGVDRAVVSLAPPLFYYELGEDLARPLCEAANRGLADFHSAFPDRFWWMAHVPLQWPDEAAGMLAELAHEAGCVGVEIGSSIVGRRLDAPDFEPLWAAAERLSLPVMIHPDTTYSSFDALDQYYLRNVVGFPLETTVTIERLIAAGVLDRHPALQILLVHGGGFFPYNAGRLRHAASVRRELADCPADPWRYLDQLWFDVITHDRDALRYLISRVGAERVVLGTDLPFDMALRDPIDRIDDAVRLELRERIAAVNPAQLYPSIANGLAAGATSSPDRR
jgi:aminocarboxymuconate-semialdehyde decarboxylase